MAAASEDRRNGRIEGGLLADLLASQRRAVDAVAAAAGAIEDAARAVAGVLRAGGRLVYLGAGSSGLIALQDGAELPGTFGLDPGRIVFLVAGDSMNRDRIDSAAEDDVAGAGADIAALGPLTGDVVIAVSASGATPYTLARAAAARAAGARVVALANRAGAPLLAGADHPILLDSGPEAVEGSTRLAAGTAQKAALGLLSTLANARLGHVHRGEMVAVRPENDKLRRRARAMIARLAGVDETTAAACLAEAGDEVKCAILLASGAATRAQAQTLLGAAAGDLDDAIARLRPRAANF
jgi:N-acetylmuramic acid 6-phosphate etherase